MTLSARTPAGADTAGFVPEIWSNQIIDAAKNELVCFDAVDHQWTVGKGKGDTVNIGITNHVTATEVVVGSEASGLDIATGTKLQLVMDQWYEAPIPIDDMTMYQSQIDWGAQARGEAEYSIRKKVDSTLAALFSALNGGTIKGQDGTAVTDDLLADITQLLDEADVPRDGNRFCIVDPSVIRDMMDYDKFVAAQYVSIGAIQNGTVVKGHPLYGANFRVTNNLTAAVTGAYCVMMHRKAIAAALQFELPWVVVEKRKHQTFFGFEALWGVKEIRDDFGIPFYSKKA